MTLGYSNPNDAMDDVIDPQEELLNLAGAFRQAQDDDIITAGNLNSTARCMNDVKNTKYFAIEMPWFRRAFPVLTGKHLTTTREQIGSIRNEPLQDPSSDLVCPQYEHGVDYVLVGPSVWVLLSAKFTVDEAIQIPLVFDSSNRNGRVHLQLTASASIPLPGTGRFSYERFVEAEVHKNDTVVSDDPTVGEEDDEDSTPQMEEDNIANNQIIILPPPRTQPTRRRFGSGLGNMGNTCFMNSTLQCLAHTEPLKRYFLSGEYRQDLNRSNPLGTGGDLATEFSSLLGEMWAGNDHVVYPRQFKLTLGKHAEQFVGYDQHDSQELATYLLDALHEDCNLVTRKPYFEKPEQGADETDEEAATKAWNLHLQRDDSRVLEYFMGQVKSRLECPDCSRVSTTFDPFMFLSVPIPGSEDRIITVHYVPLNPRLRPVKMDVKVSKMSNVEDLVKATWALRKKDAVAVPTTLEDVTVLDIHGKEIWAWRGLDQAVDQIRSKDVTVIYELESASAVREIALQSEGNSKPAELKMERIQSRQTVDLPTLTRLNNTTSSWMNEMSRYLLSALAFENAMNPRMGSTEDRVRFYRRLVAFIKDCYGAESPKRTREEMEDETELSIKAACEKHSATFRGVKTKQDIAVLEFIAKKIFTKIEEIENSKVVSPEGVTIEIKFRKGGMLLEDPFVMRIPSTTTVYELRGLITERLERCLRSDNSAGESTAERTTGTSPQLLFQVPLTCEARPKFAGCKTNGAKKKLGSIPLIPLYQRHNGDDEDDVVKVADLSHPEEQVMVSKLVGDQGKVFVEFTQETLDQLDVHEYTTVEERKVFHEGNGTKKLSIYDCIEKYCQREQLEESEQWYCSQCKERVCAWKQFQIFRSPSHLIVHLKRFQFSATSHRRQKIDSFIDFPLEGLDLRNHVHHWDEAEEPIYDCYAVSNHFGGLGGGHYTAFALNEGNIWCNYDDSRITENVDPSEVVSPAAYVLYYRRRDVPIDEEYEIDLTTPDNNAKMPVVIDDSYSRPVSWGTTQISSNAAVVDDEEMENVSVTSSNSPAEPTGYFSGANDLENQYDDIQYDENQYDDSENDPLLQQ